MTPTIINAKWTVNKKPYSEMNFSERLLLNKLFGFLIVRRKTQESKSKKLCTSTQSRFGIAMENLATKKTIMNYQFKPRTTNKRIKKQENQDHKL